MTFRAPDPMQTARNFIAPATELTTGMQNRQRQLDAGFSLGMVHSGRNTAAVIDDGNRIVGMDRDRNIFAITGQRFVDAVIDNLVDQVMQPS